MISTHEFSHDLAASIIGSFISGGSPAGRVQAVNPDYEDSPYLQVILDD